MDATDLVIYVGGTNGSSGNLGGNPKAAVIGKRNVLTATLYVPNGTLWLKAGTQARGAFIARDVKIGRNVQVWLESAFTVDGSGGGSSDDRWWNDDFFYRRQLELTALTAIVDDDMTVNTVAVTLNEVDTLIANGQLQEDGRDLRVIYEDGQSWQILPAQISPVITPTATITFSLQSPITGTSDSYWLYYGNAIADHGPQMEAPSLTESQIITGMTGSNMMTPTVYFGADSRQVWSPATVTFASKVTPPADALIWDFGDGMTVTESLTQTSHTYVAPGLYTVTLTAVTTDGMEVTYGFANYISVLSSRNEEITVGVESEEIPVVAETLIAGRGDQIVTSAQADLQVTFPEGAITQTLVITHTPYQAAVAQNEGNLSRFELTAAVKATGEQVTQFAQPVTVTLDLTQYGLTPAEADTLLFFYWDENASLWQPVTTTVDFAQGKAWAETDHFSEFAFATNYGLGTPPARRLPSVSGGGVDLLTGAATYVYPLQVPPGSHGMQPNLSLVYNSGAADTLLDQQAGLVGHGFDLAGLGWIQKDLDSGDYYLNLNGVSEKLIQEGTSSSYRTEQPTYWQIEQVSGGQNGTGKYWQVTTPDGIQYQFGATMTSTSVMPH